MKGGDKPMDAEEVPPDGWSWVLGELRGACGRLLLMVFGSRGEPGGARRFRAPIVATAKPTAGWSLPIPCAVPAEIRHAT